MVQGLDLPECVGSVDQSVARLDGVWKYYSRSDVPALKSVDLSVASGEIFTVLGPSGSGKSTLLSLIAGFERVSEGRITIGGKDMTDVPPYKRNIGMVFQDYVLFPHMSVFENVYFPLKARKFGPSRGKDLADRVRNVLRTVGLDGYQERRPAQLSGGQQQRVAVARALVYEPSVLLMDEPLSSLDRKLRKQLQAELIEVHRTLSTTIIFVTHDQEEAMTLSDRIAILSDGEVEQIGVPSDLYQNPGSLFVATFIGDANIFVGETTRSGLYLDRLDVEVRARHGLRVGESASLVIRPESLRPVALAEGDGVATNEIFGTVTQMSYRGSHLEALIETRAGTMSRAVIGVHDLCEVAPGTRVRLTWVQGSERVVKGVP